MFIEKINKLSLPMLIVFLYQVFSTYLFLKFDKVIIAYKNNYNC